MKNKYFDLIKGYIQKDDHSRNNANLVYSLPALNSMLSWAVAKDFWFDEVYKDYNGLNSRDLSEEGWIYFHNMSVLWPYCAGFSAKDIAIKWLNSNAKNNIATRAPKHYRSLLDLCANFIAVISQEIHWACAINDLTAITASYIWYHEMVEWKQIEYWDIINTYESFIYAINTPFRAWNSAFTNITMNFEWDPHLKDEYVVIWWKALDVKYDEIPEKYLNLSNEAFIDAMKLWDWEWKPFTFPLVTVNIYDDFQWWNSTFDYLLDNMDKWWGCYFENYQSEPFENENYRKLNKFVEPRDASSQRSFCCRFRVDFEDIMKASGWSSFRSNAGVWWVWVFNVNLNRIALVSKKDWSFDKGKFFEKLDLMLESVQDFAQKRRNFIENHKELYPYFFYYNKSLETFFNVISIVWWEEALVNLWFEDWLKSEEWREIAHEIATFIAEKIEFFMKRDKVPVSLEYAPSENGWPTLARKDIQFAEKINNWERSDVFNNEFFEEIENVFVQWNWTDIYLTSWFQPPYHEKNLAIQVELSAQFQSYATWWSVQHMFLWEKLDNTMKKNLVKKSFEKPVSYLTLTPTITTCQKCWNQSIWESHKCNFCSSTEVQVASRVIWYLRPISSWNLTAKNWRLDWDLNFWQDSRRNDWACRKQTVNEDIEMLLRD